MNRLEYFKNIDLIELAKDNTPLYIMSEDYIRDRFAQIREGFLNKYEDVEAIYASKAFLVKEMARIVKDEGFGIDVVSAGELYTVLAVDFPPEKIVFHGNNKSSYELEMAIKNNVGLIVIDSLEELQLLNKIAEDLNATQDILLRITPGVKGATHKYIMTAQADSKFGISLNEDYLDKTFEILKSSPNINYKGLHYHIGSQLFDIKAYKTGANIMMELIKDIKDKYGLITEELNTGGGFGIVYTDEKEMDISNFTDIIMEIIIEKSKEYDIKRPKVIIEPGRWIVGGAGITIYQIGFIKEIPDIRTYIAVDGGMTDNIRPSLYQAKYDGVILNRLDEVCDKKVTIAGKLCESGDILIEDLLVPSTVERGDYLAVFSTGAYNFSMSSNYNGMLRPELVFVKDDKARTVVKRDSYSDLLRNQI